MKDQIDWLKIESPERFQSLCNKLLHHEVSKDVVPFGAKGRDKSTDAQFSGEYSGKIGKWRFQDKFHGPTMDPNRARSLLKSEIKKELRTIAAERPDFYIVMTNVKITKGWHDKVMSEASKYLFKTEIWDGEKIESMLVKFPFIVAYHFGYSLPLFEPYQEKYKDELVGKKPLINHTTTLQGRDKEIELVKRLLTEKDPKALLLSGPHGIGKTRLAIETAKEAEKTPWIPLIVRNEAEEFDEHLKELLAEKQYLIIIDDAEDYPDIKKLFSLLGRKGWSEKIKILVTTKAKHIQEIKKELIPHMEAKNILESKLEKLTGGETKNLLSELGIKDDIIQRALFDIGKDSPLMTVLSVKLLKTGVDVQRISTEEITSIIFEKSLDRINRPENKKLKCVLTVLCIIEPVTLRNTKAYEKISEVLKIPVDEAQDLVQDLYKEGVIDISGGKIRVAPALLVEHILKNVLFDEQGKPTGSHNRIIQDFMNFAPQQVLNKLAEIEYKAGAGAPILEEFTQNTITRIAQANNIERANILSLLEGYSYFRPFDTIQIIKQIIKNPQPPTTGKDPFFGEVEVKHEEVVREIPGLLKNTAQNIESFKDSIGLLKDFTLAEERKFKLGNSAYEILKELTKFYYGRDVWVIESTNTFHYEKSWHEILITNISEWIKEDKEQLSLMCLELLGNLMKLECSYSRTAIDNRYQFIITTMTMPRTQDLTSIRDKILKTIMETVTKTQNNKIRAAAYAELGEALRILRDPKQKKIAESKTEEAQIIDFLIERLKKETDHRGINRIENCLSQIIESGRKDEKVFKDAADLLERNHAYKLYKYMVGDHHDWENLSKPEFMVNLVKESVDRYGEKELARILSGIISGASEGTRYGTIGTFMLNIGENHAEYGKKLLSLIFQEKGRLLEYAGFLVTGLRFKNDSEGKKIIEDATKLEDETLNQVIVQSYERMRRYEKFTQKDLDTIKSIATTENEAIKEAIANVLPNLWGIDNKTYLEILKSLSVRATLIIARYIGDAIAEPRAKYTGEELKTIEEIGSNFIEIDDLDQGGQAFYHIERMLKIITANNPQWVIGFFEKRLDLKQTLKKENGKYDAIPYHFHETFKDAKNHKEYPDMLRRVRDWTLKKGWYFFEAPMLFKNLCIKESHETRAKLNEEAIMVLMEWVNTREKEKIESVAYILKEFTEDENYYKIISEIILKSDSDPETLGQLSSTIFNSGGTRTRTPGHPASTDLKRIQLLEALRDKSKDPNVKRFAERQIRNTQELIKIDLERDED